jgi:hypothetical protein
MEDIAVEPVRSDRIARRTLLAGLVGTAAAAVVAPRVAAAAQGSSEAAPGTAPAGGRLHEVTMYAVALADGNYAYGLTPETASIPGPTLELVEGDTLHLRVINQADRNLSAHAHGVDYDIDNDGTPQSGSDIAPGQERTYVWRSHTGYVGDDGVYVPGSAGYWHYHDHALGGHHGTEGIRKGLYGALIVRREGDPLPDVQNLVFINDNTINNKIAPATPTFTARQGDRVEWVVVGHGNTFYTFSLKGHRWANNRTGLISGPDDASQVIDTRTVGPADSFGFQVIAGERVGPGRFEYHNHVQGPWDRGVFGWFDVLESLPVVDVTGIAPDATYGDSQTKTIRWTVSGPDATGESSATLDGAPLANGAVVPLWTLPLGSHELVVVGKGYGGDTTVTVRFTTRTSFADVETLVNTFRDQGRFAESTRSSLLDRLQRAAGAANGGSERTAIGLLEQFVSRVENQVRNDAEARSVLVRDGQALIAELRALDEAEGGR